jgi:saccharopine dehydrogenase-like NADP-dependent oxidoreductase
MRVLLIGAAGVFGSRLAEGLARSGFDLILAGRSRPRAEALAAKLRAAWPQARIDSLALDATQVTPDMLRASGAGLVVDAAGPFQGAAPVVARAAVAAGLHYVDLADARDFVGGFGVLDAKASAAGVVALTGASSTPALSHAALEAMTAGWGRIDRVEAAISPGARAPRGPSVVAAVLHWFGRPVRVFEDGDWRERSGWGRVVYRDFGAAGRRPVSLSETPDIDLMVSSFAPTSGALFMAGLQPAPLHWAAWATARLVAMTGLDARPFSGLLSRLSGIGARWGDDRGAMRVEATGVDANGRATRAVWLLIAPPGVGPYTPGLPALAAIKRIAAGGVTPGARACTGELALSEIENEMAVIGIETAMTVEPVALFPRAIGPAFEALPTPIRDLHEAVGDSVWRGQARIDGAAGSMAALVARIVGFPTAGDTAVEVEIQADGQRSVWRRRFGRHRFLSVLSNAREGGGVTERFGPLSFDLILTVRDGRLYYDVERWRMGALPLPRFLMPGTVTHEQIDAEGRFAFDVEISAPLVGRLVRYRGWLEGEG